MDRFIGLYSVLVCLVYTTDYKDNVRGEMSEPQDNVYRWLGAAAL